MLGVSGNAVRLEIGLALQDLLPERLKIQFQRLRLGQHLALFFADMVPDIFGQHGELGVAVIVVAPAVPTAAIMAVSASALVSIVII